MKARRSPWRATLAIALVAVLAGQFVLATPAGAMAFRAGITASGAVASMSEAGSAPAHHREVPADPGLAPVDDDGDPGPPPMPCGEEGTCGWGLMLCDGADSCAPLQVVPADGTFSRSIYASPTAVLSSVNKPASASPDVDGHPPRT